MTFVKTIGLLAALLMIGVTLSQNGNSSGKQPVELGTVKWSRDLDASLTSASKSGKPIFLLFQEVPG